METTSKGLPIDQGARSGAQGLWNATPCGELDGDKGQLEYFERVERDRYAQQPWQHRYFEFDRFAGKSVLEIGVGQGTDLLQFARAGATCFGADITDRHLELAKTNLSLHGLSADLRKADATRLPFEDDSMDCVYSFGVIHHIPESHLVVDEIHRVLKPGGVVMVAFYYKWSAFHLVKKLIVGGVLRGGLIRLGYRGLLATIETGADGRAVKPYVKLYSKREMRKLFGRFLIDDVSVHQLHADHILPSRIAGAPHKSVPGAGLFGWYVALKARKVSS